MVCMDVTMSGIASVKQLPSTRLEEASLEEVRGWRTQAFEWDRYKVRQGRKDWARMGDQPPMYFEEGVEGGELGEAGEGAE